jgi:hypothetical protein
MIWFGKSIVDQSASIQIIDLQQTKINSNEEKISDHLNTKYI